MNSIFNNNKNQALRNLIETNPSTSYKEVDQYLAANPAWFRGYCNYRKTQNLPYANRNAIIWEIIDQCVGQDSDVFEA